MENKPQKTSTLKIIIISTVLFALAAYFFNGGGGKQVLSKSEELQYQVAEGLAKEYKTAKRNGEHMEALIAAGATAAAYLETDNQEKYEEWKEIEKLEAEKLGIQSK